MGTKRVLCVFLVLLVFENKEQFSKTVTKQAKSFKGIELLKVLNTYSKLHSL